MMVTAAGVSLNGCFNREAVSTMGKGSLNRSSSDSFWSPKAKPKTLPLKTSQSFGHTFALVVKRNKDIKRSIDFVTNAVKLGDFRLAKVMDKFLLLLVWVQPSGE
jgi:hypothetical protein